MGNPFGRSSVLTSRLLGEGRPSVEHGGTRKQDTNATIVRTTQSAFVQSRVWTGYRALPGPSSGPGIST
ncbi:hypothetical protein DPEC_G00327360 [Dallia pectoralis]|uniref:Uncharacterized protein n=1 Tax=Dallia pectoralis TaxID=75939 RepID=A0ACC2F852_DALPE|nr:hypothetical protein DPEC_G00327360 [Dallia pectoralis]